jgi:ectoine hydroxylase-related dioxygenase (phytanoyl-CoA dioxygenase family)
MALFSQTISKFKQGLTKTREALAGAGEAVREATLGAYGWLRGRTIDEATLDNGCMHVLDRGHGAGPRPHFAIRDWQLCDTAMLGIGSVAVPLAPGGSLFFDGLLPHGTPTNRSERPRRAVQLHFCPAGSPRVTKAERFSTFGDRGTFEC